MALDPIAAKYLAQPLDSTVVRQALPARDATAVARPITRDSFVPMAKKAASFGSAHPTLRAIGITWAACSGGGAVGMAGGYAMGLAVERGAIRVGSKAFVQGPITGAIVGTLAIGTVGLIAGASYFGVQGFKHM